jgi:hypothetical protein
MAELWKNDAKNLSLGPLPKGRKTEGSDYK